ncbi:MAG: hypothetical protein VYA84_18220 [Planctomycetota bacterium]|nr:hypothetical protein [Planctomycetota bacterium]
MARILSCLNPPLVSQGGDTFIRHTEIGGVQRKKTVERHRQQVWVRSDKRVAQTPGFQAAGLVP